MGAVFHQIPTVSSPDSIEIQSTRRSIGRENGESDADKRGVGNRDNRFLSPRSETLVSVVAQLRWAYSRKVELTMITGFDTFSPGQTA